MSSEFALRRRLFRMITHEVTQVEGVEALRAYLVANLPKEHKNVNYTTDQKITSFLIANKMNINSIPVGVLTAEQRSILRPESVDDFHFESVNASSIAAIVRYLLPFTPGGQPDPSNSLWKTRLKLLSNSGRLENFVRLWRLWNKYQHNEQMNHSIPEIENDFEATERAILLVNPNPASPQKIINRFKKLMELIKLESNASVLKECVNHFIEIVTECRMETSRLDYVLGERDSLKILLNASQ